TVSWSITGLGPGTARPAPPLVTWGLPASTRHRSVEVPPASSVPTSGKPAISATTALPSAPAAGPESAVVIGFLTPSPALATPPLDGMTRNGFALKPGPRHSMHPH